MFSVDKLLFGLNRYVHDLTSTQLTGQTDETNFESVMWPRAAALAELFWTGAEDDGTYPRSEFASLRK